MRDEDMVAVAATQSGERPYSDPSNAGIESRTCNFIAQPYLIS
jgi:hypothetical protein